jgi:hypothetical protein
MKNYITKDGVSDANLIHAARGMYEALYSCECQLFGTLNDPFASELYQEVCAALAKARGEI